MKTIAAFIRPLGNGGSAEFAVPAGTRYGRIRSNGIVTLTGDTDALPVGRVTSVDVSDDGLKAKFAFAFGDSSDERTAQAAACVRSGLMKLLELTIDDDGEVLMASVVALPSDLSDRPDREDARPRFCDRRGRPLADLPDLLRMDAGYQMPDPSAAPSAPKPTTRSARERELDRFFTAREDGHNQTKEEANMDPRNPMEATRQRNRELAQRQRVARETGVSVATQCHAEPLARQDADSTPRWQQNFSEGDAPREKVHPAHREPGWRTPISAKAARLDGPAPATCIVDGTVRDVRLDTSEYPERRARS